MARVGKISDGDLNALRLSHHLDHVSTMLEHLADSLKELIGEAGGDADAQQVEENLRAIADDAGMYSDQLRDQALR